MRKSRNQLRIIGGRWRGRRLSFPEVPGLRPTPDRVRETLFNWLAPLIRGARCLDLFAGSGALGFEALSRGAVQVVLVDNQVEVIRQLKANLALLQTKSAEVIRAEALAYLDGPPTPFDVVFLDPPYQTGFLLPCIERLEQGNWLMAHSWIYLEAPAKAGLPSLPENWRVARSKIAGEVGYHLIERMVSQQQCR